MGKLVELWRRKTLQLSKSTSTDLDFIDDEWECYKINSRADGALLGLVARFRQIVDGRPGEYRFTVIHNEIEPLAVKNECWRSPPTTTPSEAFDLLEIHLYEQHRGAHLSDRGLGSGL